MFLNFDLNIAWKNAPITCFIYKKEFPLLQYYEPYQQQRLEDVRLRMRRTQEIQTENKDTR